MSRSSVSNSDNSSLCLVADLDNNQPSNYVATASFILKIVNIWSDSNLEIQVDEKDTIIILKKKINVKNSITVHCQRLFMDQTILENNQKISQYKINQNSKVYLSEVPPYFICASSHEVMQDPIEYDNKISDGDWLVENITDNESLFSRNDRLRNEIQIWLLKEKQQLVFAMYGHSTYEVQETETPFDRLLKKTGLLRWKNSFIENGFDCKENLKFITKQDLIRMGILEKDSKIIIKIIDDLNDVEKIPKHEKITIKIAVIGQCEAGKSSLLAQYFYGCSGIFKEKKKEYELTQIIDEHLAEISIQEIEEIKWDAQLDLSYLLQDINGVMIVLNINTNQDNDKDIVGEWIKQIKKINDNMVCVIVYNKCEKLLSEGRLLIESIEQLFPHIHVYFTSAVHCINIQSTFQSLFSLVYDKEIITKREQNNNKEKETTPQRSNFFFSMFEFFN